MSGPNLAFANDGSFFRQFQTQQHNQQQPAASPASTAKESEAPKQAEEPLPTAESFSGREFVQMNSFICAVSGYIFGTGAQGTGYYLDKPPKRPQLLQKKGLLLKSKPIVPGLKVTGGVSKKSKAEAASSSQYLAEMERYRNQSCVSESSSGRPLVK